MDNNYNSLGTRLRAIRGFLGLTRLEFSKRHSIPEVTLKYWELSKSAISESQLVKLLNALSKEKIYCTREWLCFGIGSSPFSSRSENEQPINPIQNEINCFLDNNPKAIIQTLSEKDIINNHIFCVSDIVGAIEIDLCAPIQDQKFTAIINFHNPNYNGLYFVIINKEDNWIVAKSLDLCSRSDVFYNPSIEKVFKIVWHRKK